VFQQESGLCICNMSFVIDCSVLEHWYIGLCCGITTGLVYLILLILCAIAFKYTKYAVTVQAVLGVTRFAVTSNVTYYF